ncbi:MAG: hypothetical protein MZV63_55330 [Marinilabiliales bacterium]|nr:hypothetical protein [Marinilabiliales bacterium]
MRNLLGGEQSGFIADVGYETYQKILDEAVSELKEEEFGDIFRKDKVQPEPDATAEVKQYAGDVTVDTDLEIMFPDEYVSSIPERVDFTRSSTRSGMMELWLPSRHGSGTGSGLCPPRRWHCLIL